MILLAVILLLAGCGFLVAEMFIPGFGFFGISGIIMLVVSSFLTALAFPFGIFIMLGEIVLIGLFIYLISIYLRKKQFRGKLILDETLNFDKRDIGDLDYFMGKEGVTKTSLRPFGVVDFNGIDIEVCSDGAYITENKRVKVTGIKQNTVIVKQLNTN